MNAYGTNFINGGRGGFTRWAEAAQFCEVLAGKPTVLSRSIEKHHSFNTFNTGVLRSALPTGKTLLL
jgi:hypothetical protein